MQDGTQAYYARLARDWLNNNFPENGLAVGNQLIGQPDHQT